MKTAWISEKSKTFVSLFLVLALLVLSAAAALADEAVEIPSGKDLTYNGKTQTGVDAGTGYTLSGTVSAVKAGRYSATATLLTGYVWSDGTTEAKTVTWRIKKAESPLKVVCKNINLSYKSLQMRASKVGAKKYLSVKNKKGTLSFVKKNRQPSVSVNKTTGELLCQKGMKKGAYKVTLEITDSGDDNYKSGKQSVTFIILVK